MNVITNTTLLLRRVAEAHRRRGALQQRREQMTKALPEWTLMPLRLAGMTAIEIRTLMDEQASAERLAGMDEIDNELELLDVEIDRIEDRLMATDGLGVDGVSVILDLALDRLRQRTVTDETNIFFDYGDARVLSLLERASEQLAACVAVPQRMAG